MKAISQHFAFENNIEQILKDAKTPLTAKDLLERPEIARLDLTEGNVRLKLRDMRRAKKIAQIPFSDPNNRHIKSAFVHVSHPEAGGTQYVRNRRQGAPKAPKPAPAPRGGNGSLDARIIDFI